MHDHLNLRKKHFPVNYNERRLYTEFERNLPSPMVTSSNVVSVKITTDSSSQSHGFQFIITPINSNTLTKLFRNKIFMIVTLFTFFVLIVVFLVTTKIF